MEYLAIVYVISTGAGHYKIGHTINLKKRVSVLQTGCPFPLNVIHSFECSDAAGTEKQLHDRFSSKRAAGEWFTLDAEDLDYLLSLGVDGQEEEEEEEGYWLDGPDPIEDWIDTNTPLWGPL